MSPPRHRPPVSSSPSLPRQISTRIDSIESILQTNFKGISHGSVNMQTHLQNTPSPRGGIMPPPNTPSRSSNNSTLRIMPAPPPNPEDQLAQAQLTFLQHEINYETPPHELCLYVDKTALDDSTVRAATNYAHARLMAAHAQVEAIEAEMDVQNVTQRGHGRQLEASIAQRAQHVSDAAWIAGASVTQMKWEITYAMQERKVMEMVAENLQGVLDWKGIFDWVEGEGRLRVHQGPLPNAHPHRSQRRRSSNQNQKQNQTDPKTPPNNSNRGNWRGRARGRGQRGSGRGNGERELEKSGGASSDDLASPPVRGRGGGGVRGNRERDGASNDYLASPPSTAYKRGCGAGGEQRTPRNGRGAMRDGAGGSGGGGSARGGAEAWMWS